MTSAEDLRGQRVRLISRDRIVNSLAEQVVVATGGRGMRFSRTKLSAISQDRADS